MLQRLPIVLVQIKASNTSQKLGNEMKQILYSFYQKKLLLKRLHKYNEFNKVIKQNEYYIYEF